jgi:lipopolysaccharide/colanic/teichoic acid biosynthesis glycosyltransferase
MRNQEVKVYYDILHKKRASLAVKRVFDLVCAAVLLVVLFPLLVLISIVIKIDSAGHVFFLQQRVTQYGRRFKIIKFRTMTEDAEKKGSQITVDNDVRITKIGKLLRKTRLDELPQLVNILAGQMSFVGTRPEVIKFVDCYTNEMLATLLMPAGVTSEASIKYKDEDRLLSEAEDVDGTYIRAILPKKMVFNLKSLREFSFFSDLRTMLRTISAILTRCESEKIPAMKIKADPVVK